jgi:EAL domain-containing protein (putative c-di-GMP-specific phosphodiesterase class I)
MIALKTVRDLGAKIAIDDFGTGHASLTSLVRIKPDMLKLDRFIVHNCQTNSVGRTVLTMALQMAKDLGIKTVCEGIETADQEASVCEEGADFLQGFRYSPAVPVSELACLPKIFATNATDDLLKRDNEVSAIDGAVEAPLALPSLVS